jgi:drug/metabolite transporter (DMT)-like permease
MTTIVPRPSLWRIIMAFAAVYLIWGSTYLAIKYAIETLPPFLMSGGRFLIAGAALTVWSLFRRGAERPEWTHWRSAVVIGALLFLGGNGGVVWAEQFIASGLAALLVATEPLWIVLFGWLRPGGVRPTGKTALGLVVGFAGVWLLIGSGISANNGTDNGTMLGIGVVIAAAFSWASGSLYSLRAPLPESPLLTSGMQMLAGGALLTLAGTFSGEWAFIDASRISAVSVGAFLYLVVFGSIIAFTAYSWLLRVTTPARAATYAYVNPVVAVVLGWALAGELLTARTLLGAGVIVASVVLLSSYGKHGDRKMAEPIRDDVSTGEAGDAVHSLRHLPESAVVHLPNEGTCERRRLA